MTIAGEFNKITEKLGGDPSTSGTITGAIDALNDTLAGSDQPAALTIEGAVRLLGQHIGGGSLSPATADTLGGVKIGDGINVTEDGTISASGGSVFDAEIKVTATADSADPWVCEIVSGTYAELAAMIDDGTAPSVLVRQFNEANTRGYGSTMTFVQHGEEGELSIYYQIGYSDSGVPKTEGVFLIWYENDTIALD